MAAAAASASAGRALDAIDDLTRLNRARRDPRVERQLVGVRHAASSELPASGRSEWPPTLVDPFPEEQRLPAVEAAQLSGAVVGGGITNHGCVRVNGLIEASAVGRLKEQIDRAFDGRARLADGADPSEVAPWYVPFEAGREEADGYSSPFFVRVVDAPGTMWEVVELFERTGVIAAVAEYFGERPTMIANKWVLRRAPHGADGTDFHQDGAFLGEGIRTVNCWIALSDCGPGTGRPALELVPRRFPDIIPTGVGAKHTWSLAEDTVLQAAPDVSVAQPVIDAGDALFFDERMPHRTTNGPELGTRYAIESWFVAPSSSLPRHEPIVV